MLQQAKKEPKLGELISELSMDLLALIRQEVEFAKVEMTDKATRAARDSVLLGLGAGLAFAGLLVLLFGAVIALSKVFSPLMSAIIVGVIVVSAGLVLLAVGYWKLSSEDFTPKRTVELIEEEGQWMKRQVM